ncbi:hypothetical protein HPP92_012088 [Vanilla planifolia]|uniref:Uncharacterized protein n=1 Tax=Vanilla planifolia TaxID=51239 RepID=A0A835R866_VANPL|nr:hypothetical protein HPP92_012088 [Vanilla planifolia]
MSSVCKSAVSCVDARLPLRSSYVNLHKWAESDAEFVRSVASGFDPVDVDGRRLGQRPNPRVVDSYSCRQMYLRSYTFSKKETVHKKTMKYFERMKEKAAELTFTHHQRRESGGSFSSLTSQGSSNDKKSIPMGNTKEKNKKKDCSIFYTIFRSLLLCTTSVDVADAGGGHNALQFGG